MKRLLFIALLAGTLSCKEDAPEISGTWKTSCETFAKTTTGYVFSDCCGSIDFPGLELSAGTAIIQEGSYIDKNQQITPMSVKINVSKKGDVVLVSTETAEGQAHYSLEKEYSGPVCDCTCP